jgi:hypothetical protein
MVNIASLFRPKYAVLSLNAQAQSATPARERSQFEVLVRHLLYRFFHNELLASDDETRRIMLISYVFALPTLLVSLFLFPAYHSPLVHPRHFWPQVGDHYFYVMYSLFIMGGATVYEWDLLFPDLLDVFVLSILPISTRRLFFARVLALTIFLALVLIGTSVLGMIFFPVLTEIPPYGRHLLAHIVAPLMSGTFAAATFLALQGILLNTIGERAFRRITPVLQGGSLMLLLTVLLLYPTLAPALEPLLTSGSAAVRCFPPFWFLGVYERIAAGPSALPIFGELAHTGCIALLIMLPLTLVTYPLAYRRRVRQLVEGSSAIATSGPAAAPLHRVLHAIILRLPAQRAIFHLVSQTILRSQRQRVMLALYGGLALALAIADMLVLRIGAGHVHPSLLPYGIRAAVPIMAFWTVMGLSSVVNAPIDRRGSWVFSVLIGRPGPGHLDGVRLWITLWTMLISLTAALILRPLSPADMRTPLITATQLLVAIGISLLLADIRLFPVRTVPFTHLHRSSVSDFPLMILRYFILFPFFVAIVVDKETWIEASLIHFLKAALLIAAAHILFLKAHAHSLSQSTLETPPDESDEFPQRLGLRDV